MRWDDQPRHQRNPPARRAHGFSSRPIPSSSARSASPHRIGRRRAHPEAPGRPRAAGRGGPRHRHPVDMLTLILVNMQLLAYHIAVVRGTHADVVKPWDSGILGDAV